MARNLRRKRIEYLSRLFEDELDKETANNLKGLVDRADKDQNHPKAKGRMARLIQDAQVLGEAKKAVKPEKTEE